MTTRMSRGRAQSMSRERARASALDHLHTEATELARYASKAAESRPAAVEVLPTSNPNPSSRTRTTRTARLTLSARWRRVIAATGALVFAGFATAPLAGGNGAAFADNELAPSSVVAIGAPRIAPKASLALRAGVVGITSNPSGRGYWLVGGDGGVFSFGQAGFFGSTGNDRLNAPITAIASTSDGQGYWLVADDGGVFAFGNARFHGSTGAFQLASPIVSIIPTQDDGGYWLVGADGGVFAFGNAHFHGSAVQLQLAGPIAGATGTPTGHGYWLLGSDGGVFAFGDAAFHGARHDTAQPAVGIAASPDSDGYWVARADGTVDGFGVPVPKHPAPLSSATTQGKTVGITASARGGYWLAVGPAEPPKPSLGDDPFLACTRAHESDQAGGYAAVSPGGMYRGAYQFDRSTWNNAAAMAGRHDLVGADPASVAPDDQDLVAMTLYRVRGAQPWGNRCTGLS